MNGAPAAATVTSVWKKLLPTTYVSISVKVRVRVPSTDDATVVTRYGLDAVPEPVSDWLTGVNCVSAAERFPVVCVPPG